MKLAIFLILSLFTVFVSANRNDEIIASLISQINDLYNNVQNVINGIRM